MCTVCHGIDGRGGVGPNLTDGTWLHSKGSYSEIVQQITAGVPTKQSKSGIPMPPRGGSGISEAQVKDVAAYVWTLSHPAPK
jgi:cytochrome c oxidase cbb3-type subunit 3